MEELCPPFRGRRHDCLPLGPVKIDDHDVGPFLQKQADAGRANAIRTTTDQRRFTRQSEIHEKRILGSAPRKSEPKE